MTPAQLQARADMDAIPPALTPPPGQTVTGWRFWRLSTDRQLMPPFASLGPFAIRDPWQPGINTARCCHRHPAPDADCECGFRAMPRLADMLIVLDIVRRTVAVTTIDAVGLIELSGRIIGPSDNDPGGTLRGEHGRLIRLHLADHHADRADALAARLGVPVTAGRLNEPGGHTSGGWHQMTARYAIVNLATGGVLDQADDLGQALGDLDDAKFWRDEDDDDGRDPDVVVVDLDRGEMCDVDRGEVTWHWLDGFSGVWRRRLA